MIDYLLLYRLPADSPHHPDSPQQMQERMEKWMTWFNSLRESGAMKEYGHPLMNAGRVVRGARRPMQDGPFAESKDVVIGYTVITARDIDHASEVANSCPVIGYGGLVEIRPLRQM